MSIEGETFEGLPVTICPPGKRTLRRPAPVSERVAIEPAKEARMNALTVAREQQRLMSVVRNQPHRRDLADPDHKRAGDPLWSFCQDRRLKPALYAAGVDYGALVRQYRVVIDAPATGLVSGPSDGDVMTDEQRAAAAALVKKRMKSADAELTSVMARAPSRMADLCCDMLPLRPNDESMIQNCLYRLAIHFKTIDFGINAEKVY